MKERKTEIIKIRVTKSLKEELKAKGNISKYLENLILKDLNDKNN